jgi:hypothetical protein
MISKEERMYFIDPLQPAQVRRTNMAGEALSPEVLVLRYRRPGLKEDRIGSVVPVTHQRLDSGEVWWVDSDGDYLYGAQVVDRIGGRGNVMAIVSDELFIVGRLGGEHHAGGGVIINNARRSDGKRFPGLADTHLTYVSNKSVSAAPWAHELMPVPGDSDEVVAAKVARAKQQFIQRRKKGEIYKEGMRRDWLNHLDTLRPNHDMPTPVFSVGIEGTFLSAAGENVPLEELSNLQRERVVPIQQNSIIRPDHGPREGHAQQFVGAPFAAVTGHTVNNYRDMHAMSVGDVRYAVFDALRIHSGHVLENNRFAILTSF